MITLHIFTEELSAKKVFDNILPKILPDNVYFRIYPHQGKQDLEKALKNIVPSISKAPGSKILITRDQDSGNCIEVKNKIKNIIGQNCSCDYKIRIACTELENWFLGDLLAINKAYPRFQPEQYQQKADFRNVDGINAPDEYLLKIIPEFKKRTSLPKLEVADLISQNLNIHSNKSNSFKQVIKAIIALTGSKDVEFC